MRLFPIGISAFLLVWVTSTSTASAEPEPKVFKVGTRPESVTKGFGGKYFVTVMNEPTTPGDGVVKVLEGDTTKDFATGFDEPKGICFTGQFLVTTDVKRVWKIDAKGTATILAAEDAFPNPVSFLNDTACEPGGKAVYVSDMGANTKMWDPKKVLWPLDSPEAKALPAIGRIYRIDLKGKVTIVQDASPEMPCPNGVAAPAKGRVLVAEFFQGRILEIKAGKLSVLATGFRGADGLEEDGRGRLYVSSFSQGKLWRVSKSGQDVQLLLEGLLSAADFFLDTRAGKILLPDMKAGTITVLPIP